MSAATQSKTAIGMLNNLRDKLCKEARLKHEKSADYMEGYHDGIFDVCNELAKEINLGNS